MKLPDKAIARAIGDFSPDNPQLEAVYERELEALRQIAAKKDFSEAGQSEFFRQTYTVKTAYLALCLRDQRIALRSGS